MNAQLLCVLVAAVAAHAIPTTFKTRSGVVYKDALITGLKCESATVSYSGGIATVLLEDLPADVQEQIGYVPLAKREVLKPMVDPEVKALMAKIEAETKKELTEEEAVRKRHLASLPKPSKEEAGAYFKWNERDVRKTFGRPLEFIRDLYHDGDGYKILIYEKPNAKVAATYFILTPEGEQWVVTGGMLKGEAILSQSNQSAMFGRKEENHSREIGQRLLSAFEAKK